MGMMADGDGRLVESKGELLKRNLLDRTLFM